MGKDKLAEALAGLRAECAGGELQGGRPISELAAELMLNTSGGQLSISFELDDDDNDRFVMITSPGHSIG